MEKNIYKVWYNPTISKEVKSFIRENISHSMISNDEESFMYDASFILAKLEKIDEPDFGEDLKIISEVDCDYLEF